MDATSAAFAVPLPVLVVNDRDGVQHRGTLQLPRRAPASPGRPPSSADLARLRPLMSALGDALAAQEEGLDPERLSRTYAALMAELQEAAGMGVHAVELTPATLAPVLPEGQQGDERRNAQLAELPEGLRAMAGEMRELAVRSTRLAVVPVWVGELTRLEALEVSCVGCKRNTLLKSLPASLGQLGALKQLTLAWLDGLELLPDAVVRLTSLGSLMLQSCYKLKTLPKGLGKLGALKQLTLVDLYELQEMPDPIGLTALGSLTIQGCYKLKTLPRGLGKLGALTQLTLWQLHELQEMPDLIELTALGSLTIQGCYKLKTLPRGLGKLGALTQLTLGSLNELQEMPDPIGLTALGSLTIKDCYKLKTLPRGLGKLGALTQLTLQGLRELQEMPDLIGLTALGSLKLECGSKLRVLPGGLGELPCIEALTVLHELCLDVADYAQGSRAFTALSRSLPCLQQLQVLRLRASDVDPTGWHDGEDVYVALQARDVLAIGRAIKAWPLPLLRVGDVDEDDVMHFRLSTCWRALGLPAAAAGWTNTMTLDYLRVQQQKVAAFASGMHARLGAASGVSWLDEQALVMIADEVLGGWGLLKEWRQELVAANV
jgi:hypothetical protein